MECTQRSYYRRQKMLHSYISALILLAISIFLMPIVNNFEGIAKILFYVDGLLFWISLILTVVTAVKINNSRRHNSTFNVKYKGLKKLGLIHFFQNKHALIMDVIMFASLISLIILYVLRWNVTLEFLFVSLFLFSFGMHCMLNGINYIYIKHKIKN